MCTAVWHTLYCGLRCRQCGLAVALVSNCKSQDRFQREKTLGLEWGLNPQPYISSVMLYQAPWEQGCGEEGLQVLVNISWHKNTRMLTIYCTYCWYYPLIAHNSLQGQQSWDGAVSIIKGQVQWWYYKLCPALGLSVSNFVYLINRLYTNHSLIKVSVTL